MSQPTPTQQPIQLPTPPPAATALLQAAHQIANAAVASGVANAQSPPSTAMWIDPDEQSDKAYHAAYDGAEGDMAEQALGPMPAGHDPMDWEDKVHAARDAAAATMASIARQNAVNANTASGAQPPSTVDPEAPPRMTQQEIDELVLATREDVFDTKLRRRSMKDSGGWIGTDDGLYDDYESVRDKDRPSDTAIDVDLWGRRMGRILHRAEWNDNPNFVPGSDNPSEQKHLYDEHTLCDVHAACFEPDPQIAKNPKNRVAAEWFKSLLESDEFQGLRNSTVLDRTMSEIGSANIASQWTEYYATLSEKEKQEINSGNQSVASEMKRLASTSKAAKSAREDVGNAEAAGRGMGMLDGQNVNTKKLMDAFKRVRDNDSLRRIMNMAGKMRRAAASLQRRKSKHATDEVVGVTTGGEIARVIPSELAQLVDPDLELDFLRRLVERQVLSWEQSGTEPVAKGPIIVCVDESGSMQGEPHDHAKALALALGWVAMHQKRWIGFIGFSGGLECTHCAFPPGEWDQDRLIQWLTHFYGGGTTLQAVCVTLPFGHGNRKSLWEEWGVPDGKTDVVVVTDDEVSIHGDELTNFLEWKAQKKAKLYGLCLGGVRGEGLKRIADRVWSVTNIDTDTDPVQEMLSM